MTENIKVGQTLTYEAVWFDGPSGTGNEMPDPGQGTFASDNPSVVSAQASEMQACAVTGVGQGSANVQGTSSTGVVAGSLDANGVYVAGPLGFLCTAAAAIVSGILRLRAALGAAPKRA